MWSHALKLLMPIETFPQLVKEVKEMMDPWLSDIREPPSTHAVVPMLRCLSSDRLQKDRT